MGFGFRGRQKWSEDRVLLRKLAKKYKTLVSGGADIHRPENFIQFAASGNYAKETISLAETIVKQSKVNTQWSSL